MKNRARTLDELNEKYGFKEITVQDGTVTINPVYKKHIDKIWEIDHVYSLVAGDQISLGKARELSAAIIESTHGVDCQNAEVEKLNTIIDELRVQKTRLQNKLEICKSTTLCFINTDAVAVAWKSDLKNMWNVITDEKP